VNIELKRGLYSYALDGGAPGTISLRGSQLQGLEFFWRVWVFVLAPFALTPGTTMDFGYAGALGAILPGLDPQYFSGAAPDSVSTSLVAYPNWRLASGSTPLTMTISGLALVSGELELVVEAVRA
jgi:hypothetical protein